jgi:holin-like protein
MSRARSKQAERHRMLGYLTVIFCCQLAGELIVAASGLPIPGPVIGMAILFAGLLYRGSLPPDLAAVAGLLLNNLSMLFVPAGVGVMLHISLLSRELLSISVALVVSTSLAIAITGLMMNALSEDGASEPPAGDNTNGAQE